MAGVAAEAVVTVHLAYLLYVALGALLALRNIHWLWPHLVTAVWGVTVLLTQVQCPLTVLEKHLRTLDGAEPYNGTFIGYYLDGVVYPEGWRDGVWYATALFVLGVYVLALVRHSAAKRLASS
jgi:hypothetical protein